MGLGLNDARRMLIGGFIAWAMVAAHSPLEAQSSATDVDLSGIGEVQVEADPVLLAPFADLTIHGIEPDVLLYFDIDGRPTDCRPNSDRPAAFVELLCRELLAKGHLELPAGYDLAGQRGFLPVHAGGSAAAVEAVEPIAFAAGEGGQELAVFTAAAPNVAKGPCMVMELGGGPALAEKGKQAICAAFQRGGDETQRKCVQEGIERGVAQRWRCSILTRTVAEGAPPEVTLRERPLAPLAAPVYPPFDLPDDRMLAPGSATVQLNFSEDDYPLFAIRYAWEGRSEILLGIADGNSRIVSCRPIVSSGFPVLDNTACRIALRRGRVAMSPGSEGGGAIRYLRQSVAWKLP